MLLFFVAEGVAGRPVQPPIDTEYHSWPLPGDSAPGLSGPLRADSGAPPCLASSARRAPESLEEPEGGASSSGRSVLFHNGGWKNRKEGTIRNYRRFGGGTPGFFCFFVFYLFFCFFRFLFSVFSGFVCFVLLFSVFFYFSVQKAPGGPPNH